MEAAEAGVTYSKILPFILAVLLIFLIPMLMRRYGLDWSDVTRFLFSRPGKRDYAEAAKGKKKREPWQTNGRSQDISQLVSTLLVLARRQKLGLVYPGTVRQGAKTSNLVAFVVTRSEVIGVDCFGYGGTVTETEKGWSQHMNGADQPIPDPLAACREQQRLVRTVLDGDGLADVPLRIVAVFTSRTVALQTEHGGEVFDTKGLIAHLRRCASEQKGALDPDAVARRINAHVVRIKRCRPIPKHQQAAPASGAAVLSAEIREPGGDG